jgi:hypothetical protein
LLAEVESWKKRKTLTRRWKVTPSTTLREPRSGRSRARSTTLLKYVVVDGRPIPAESIAVDPDEQRVSIPFDRETVESAPRMESFSGAFDDAVHEHYGLAS